MNNGEVVFLWLERSSAAQKPSSGQTVRTASNCAPQNAEGLWDVSCANAASNVHPLGNTPITSAQVELLQMEGGNRKCLGLKNPSKSNPMNIEVAKRDEKQHTAQKRIATHQSTSLLNNTPKLNVEKQNIKVPPKPQLDKKYWPV